MDQRRFFLSRPPECLSGFVATPIEPPQSAVDQPGIHSYFKLACECGAPSFFVHGFRWQSPGPRSETLFLSPLILECIACRKCTLAFDSNFHGFDAEQGIRTNRRAEGTRGIFECRRCGEVPLEIEVALEYSEDRFDGSMPEFAGREQDLFNSLTMYAACVRCLLPIEVASFECD
jgi:hypothetical protein